MATAEPPTAAAEPPARRSPPGWLSIVGGAIVPGLGHLLLGRRRRAAILFAPIVVLAAVASVALVAAPDRAELAGELLTPEALEALAVIVVAVGLYRLAVLGATFVLAARLQPVGRLERLGRAFLTALLAVAIAAPHIIAGAVIVDTRQTIMDVFDPADLGAAGDGAGSELIPPLEPDDTNSPAPSGSTDPRGRPSVGTPDRPPDALPQPDRDARPGTGLGRRRPAQRPAHRRRRGPRSVEPADRHDDPAVGRRRHGPGRDVRLPAQHDRGAAAEGERRRGARRPVPGPAQRHLRLCERPSEPVPGRQRPRFPGHRRDDPEAVRGRPRRRSPSSTSTASSGSSTRSVA